MNYIEVEGLEEVTDMLKDATIDDADIKKGMRKAVNTIGDEIEMQTPKGKTRKLSKLKRTVKNDGLAVVGEIKLGMFYGIFQEFGTSRSKKNIGFFERSVTGTQDKVIEILSKELLDKVFK
ncbi:HK97-gp10 family putative phage morphogenesis protein [Clostridium senegalense]|uniref:HK97-gp10 family putative phage morphogenesis protein n=1 Tax=Clostridium senegalense TaxID=1465809 RepID=UPI0002890A47|nr:HK97-gp10 family putative phage morphogenesis protein [Clostridium senegalense]